MPGWEICPCIYGHLMRSISSLAERSPWSILWIHNHLLLMRRQVALCMCLYEHATWEGDMWHSYTLSLILFCIFDHVNRRKCVLYSYLDLDLELMPDGKTYGHCTEASLPRRCSQTNNNLLLARRACTSTNRIYYYLLAAIKTTLTVCRPPCSYLY